ncbi:Ig-like domain-containing protein, partial [Bradyrhizobium sp. CCBAU 11361]|uniref:Ig-like domain-containing protein n=1 Tax=Bradyrhizobium sp. CCBAU 11361 TaxID=1630812 RepID=UPI002303B7D4
VGTATVDASGNWSFATGTLVDGTHAFTGQAVDAAGNVSVTSGALNVTIDTVAPNAPVLVSDTLAASNKVVVSGTAEAGSTITLYEGRTLLGSSVTASNGTWSVTTGSLADGAHAFTATATDAAGNVSSLSAVLDPIVGTVIESIGSASLIEIGNNFYVGNASTGYNAELKFAGVAQVVDPTGRVTPLGAEKTATG